MRKGKKINEREGFVKGKSKNQVNILQSFEYFSHLIINYQDNVVVPNRSMVL